MSTPPLATPIPETAPSDLGSGHRPLAEDLLYWPPFPLLASTQFCMEVLLRGSVLDLRSLREILTFDPCALLRIFARTAEEFVDPETRPQRLDECIVALGAAGLVRALQHTPSTWQQQARLSAFADRGVLLGRCAQTLAGTFGMCQETAFLLGMLHHLAELPHELGWYEPPTSSDETFALTSWIIEQYKLPAALEHAILSSQHCEPKSVWSLLLQAAQGMTEQNIPLPQLQIDSTP